MKILLQGGFGRMGHAVFQQALKRQWEVIRFPHGTAGAKLLATAPWDAIVDFSSESGLLQSLELARYQSIPLISGTTGLGEETHRKMRQIAAEVPLLWAANFSFGMAIFEELLEVLAAQLPKGYDIRLSEIHRRDKKDSPSGTATELVRRWNSIRKKCPMPESDSATEEQVIIQSVRAGEVPGTHQWSCFGANEILSISHQALSRDVFAEGALRATEILVREKFPAGYYGLRDLLSRS